MDISSGAFTHSKQSTLTGQPFDGGSGKRGKEAEKGKLVFPKIPKNYKPSAKVMAMTLGKLPEGVDLEKEIIWMKTQETATI